MFAPPLIQRFRCLLWRFSCPSRAYWLLRWCLIPSPSHISIETSQQPWLTWKHSNLFALGNACRSFSSRSEGFWLVRVSSTGLSALWLGLYCGADMGSCKCLCKTRCSGTVCILTSTVFYMCEIEVLCTNVIYPCGFNWSFIILSDPGSSSQCLFCAVVPQQVSISGSQQSVSLDRPPVSASQTQGAGQLLQHAAGALPPELRQRWSVSTNTNASSLTE